jgi:tetratricopeptide (TPR) repeat protein
MLDRFCFFLSLVLILPFMTRAESLSELKKQNVKLTADLFEVSKLKKAIELSESILEKEPNDFETLVLYSRVCWSLGNQEAEKSSQKDWFKKGQEKAEQLKEAYPDKPDGYYWYTVNYGEWVDRSSIFSKIGAKKIIVENMQQVLSLDEKYDSGGAYIVLGRINYIAPGGSYKKAIEYYEKAMNFGPKRTTAFLYLAELYLHEHIFDKAENLLKKVISMEVESRYAIEARADKKTAERLLKKADKLDDHFPSQDDLTGR